MRRQERESGTGVETTDASWFDSPRELLVRIAASGLVPARAVLGSVPDVSSLPARRGRLRLEIVTHCWQYEHLLAYQLSSLVNHPPRKLLVRMTVAHTPEDGGTLAVLESFGRIRVPGVTWNWLALSERLLLRRAIGRNRAALATEADWVWFTDCDVIFHEGCLDGLADQLQGRNDPLVFPGREHCTQLLPEGDPMLARSADGSAALVEIDVSRFSPRFARVAKGPMQITHGDVARRWGYCASLEVYQKPARRWRKAWEDRAFRWLLGTDGVAIDVPGVYRIRHASKGRYGRNRATAMIRRSVRRSGSWVRDRLASIRASLG